MDIKVPVPKHQTSFDSAACDGALACKKIFSPKCTAVLQYTYAAHIRNASFCSRRSQTSTSVLHAKFVSSANIDMVVKNKIGINSRLSLETCNTDTCRPIQLMAALVTDSWQILWSARKGSYNRMSRLPAEFTKSCMWIDHLNSWLKSNFS